MANYPDAIYKPRVLANKPGTEYAPEKTTRLFAEDQNGTNEEIVAVQEELGTNPKGAAGSVKERIEDIESLVPTAPFIKASGEVYKDAEAKLINAIYSIITPANILALWIFDPTTGTTIKDRSIKNHDLIITPDISASVKGFNGLAPYVNLDEASDKYSTADHTDFTFGDGSNDSAFSIMALAKPANDAAYREIICKLNQTTGNEQAEWEFVKRDSNALQIRLFDNSVNKYIGRITAAKAVTGAWQTLIATYSGSRTAAGCKLFCNGVRVDTTDAISGGYVAMEKTTSEVASVKKDTAGVAAYPYKGDISLIAICKEELTSTQIKRLDYLLKGYANLTL